MSALLLTIHGTHQGRIVAEVNDRRVIATPTYLHQRLARLVANSLATVDVGGVHVDESTLTSLLRAAESPDTREIPTCNPWGRHECDQPGLHDDQGRPCCAAHLPDDDYYPED